MDRDPEEVLRSILLLHRERLAKHGTDSEVSRFEHESSLFYREARLLALAYPAAVEPLASKLALDGSADRTSRDLSTYLLYVLAGQGNSAAVNSLLRLANDQGAINPSLVVAGLSSSDDVGRYKDIYLAKCKEGSPTAFEAVSKWLDQGTLHEMKKQLETANKSYAENVIRRMEVLADARCDEQLEAIVRHKLQNDFDGAGPWAINSLRSRDVNRLRIALRSELDQTFRDVKEHWQKFRSEHKFEDSYIAVGEFGLGKGICPSDYDDYLVSMLEAGGQLTEIESARLRTFGYGCDPETRLAELLTTQ